MLPHSTFAYAAPRIETPIKRTWKQRLRNFEVRCGKPKSPLTIVKKREYYWGLGSRNRKTPQTKSKRESNKNKQLSSRILGPPASRMFRWGPPGGFRDSDDEGTHSLTEAAVGPVSASDGRSGRSCEFVVLHVGAPIPVHQKYR